MLHQGYKISEASVGCAKLLICTPSQGEICVQLKSFCTPTKRLSFCPRINGAVLFDKGAALHKDFLCELRVLCDKKGLICYLHLH